MNARPCLTLALGAIFSLPSLPAVAQPPQVTIVALSASEHVTGQITIRATVDRKADPKALYVGINKGCWTKMERRGETIEWRGSLDSTLVPNGQRTIEIFCLTDHLEKVDDAEWRDTREVAWKAVSRTPPPGSHYYFVKVTQADGNQLWSGRLRYG